MSVGIKQFSNAAVSAPLSIRQLYIFKTLEDLNEINRHAPNVYALVTDGDLVLVSNGVDTWSASTVTDLVTKAANQQIWITGNLTFSEAAAYIPPKGGEGIRYLEIDESTVL